MPGKRKISHTSDWVSRNLPYVFFLIFLAMTYIANAHLVDKKIRKIDKMRDQIKELNWRYMSVKSDLIYQGTYSEISSEVEKYGLSNEGDFPKIINAKDNWNQYES